MGSTDHIRERDIVFRKLVRGYYYVCASYLGGCTKPTYDPDSTNEGRQVIGRQRTYSVDNSRWKVLQKYWHDPRYRDKITPELLHVLSNLDAGSPFYTFKNEYWDNSSINDWSYTPTTDLTYHRYGRIYAKSGALPKSTLWPVLTPIDDNQLIVAGTEFVKKTIPGSPAFNSLVSLGELYRDGLPSIPGREIYRRKNPKGFASEYLNFEFGIKPVVSDLKSLREAILNHQKILNEYRKQHGKRVRRKRSLPVVRTEELISEIKTPPQGLPAGVQPSTYGKQRLHRITEDRIWFSAAYTTFTRDPDVDSSIDRLLALEQELYRLYGIRLTPDVAWNLLPWSWLSDWFLNVGDVVHNMSVLSQGDVVMRYGYVMRTTRITDRWTSDPVRSVCGETVQSFSTVHKRRIRANPFGFGLKGEDLTPRQWAILAALGITRV